MDLIEVGRESARRHPWETSRLAAIRRILDYIPFSRTGLRVIDVGCGDGYVSREIARLGPIGRVTAVDIHLPADRLDGGAGDPVRFVNRFEDLPAHDSDIMLLLDVIEHVEDDQGFLAEAANKYLVSRGFVLITAPAYQMLFGPHDAYLRHYRRYRRGGLLRLARAANLEHVCSGYLFFSPLVVRSIGAFGRKLFPATSRGAAKGIGDWTMGPVPTRIIDGYLRAENRVLLECSRLGIRIPGLTAWALCRRPQ